MTTKDQSLSTDLVSVLNRGNQQAIPTAFQVMQFGDVMRALPVRLRGMNPVAAGVSPYSLSTCNAIVLPDDAKAAYILRATAMAGQTGEMTLCQYGTDPSTNSGIGVGPNGDLVFLAAGAVTNADILYVPEAGDVVELTIAKSSADTILLPSVMAGAILLLEAEITKGTVTGKQQILKPADTCTTDNACNLKLNKLSVVFDSTAVMLEARLKVLVKSSVDVNALLENETGIF